VRPVYANISRDDKGADLPGDGGKKSYRDRRKRFTRELIQAERTFWKLMNFLS
jgi:hypothetical protein